MYCGATGHEPIIDQELFDAVQELFNKRAKGEKQERGLFQGFVKCGVCKRLMAYQGVGGKA